MGFDKFKSYKATANEPYESKNPYVQKAVAAQRANSTVTPPDGGDEKTNFTLISKIHQLNAEIKDLKMDIASLLLMMAGETDTKFNALDAKRVYLEFRASQEHLLQRITNKIDNQGNSNI